MRLAKQDLQAGLKLHHADPSAFFQAKECVLDFLARADQRGPHEASLVTDDVVALFKGGRCGIDVEVDGVPLDLEHQHTRRRIQKIKHLIMMVVIVMVELASHIHVNEKSLEV